MDFEANEIKVYGLRVYEFVVHKFGDNAFQLFGFISYEFRLNKFEIFGIKDFALRVSLV